MSEWLEFWDYTSTDWAGLTFAVVVVALIVAWIEARGAAASREAQARPFVTLDLHADKSFLIFLTVANTGGSMARDVTFKIEPELESEALPTIPKLKMFDPNGGIAALPPGKRITPAFDFWPERVKRPTSRTRMRRPLATAASRAHSLSGALTTLQRPANPTRPRGLPRQRPGSSQGLARHSRGAREDQGDPREELITPSRVWAQARFLCPTPRKRPETAVIGGVASER